MGVAGLIKRAVHLAPSPQHPNSKWAGLRTFTPDRLPVCGFDPHAPGFFWLAGQGGFGLQTSPAMALAAEALVADEPWPDELQAVEVTPDQLSPSRIA